MVIHCYPDQSISAHSEKLKLRFHYRYLSDFDKGKPSFSVFIYGKGHIKYKTKDFIGELIPKLKSVSIPVIKEYSALYGEHCTKAEMWPFMAGITVESEYLKAMRCKINYTFFNEFKEKFDVGLETLAEHTLGVFGIWAFDIIAFDEFLHKQCGYKEEKHGSMQDYLIKKFGAGFAERFKINCIDKS